MRRMISISVMAIALITWGGCRRSPSAPQRVDVDPPSMATPDVAHTVAQVRTVDFARDVLPIFRDHCFECHGPDRQASSYRLDIRDVGLAAAEMGDLPIVSGDRESSPLYQYIRGGDSADLVMPPEDEGAPLSAEQIETIGRWIDEGAVWPDEVAGDSLLDSAVDHWSLKPIEHPTPPPVPEDWPDWQSQPIDGFVFQAMSQHGLTPSPPADRVQWIRRVYLIMHGLLPTDEQVAQFINDSSPDARDKVIESVLASPRYGERWGQHWLDVVHYADTHGFEANRFRPNAYYYRDYVIEAFNSDKPYDQFIVEQLAGDAVGEDRGTGFLVAGPYDVLKSPNKALTLMQRQDELADMVDTTGTTFLGLTIGCARCHNHKFDPILQRDYYQLQAIFAGVQHDERLLELPEDRELQQRLPGLMKELIQSERWLRQLRTNMNGQSSPVSAPSSGGRDGSDETGTLPQAKTPVDRHRPQSELDFIDRLPRGRQDDVRARYERLVWLRKEVSKAEVDRLAYLGTFAQPGPTYRLYRGDPMSPREEVIPDTLTVLGSLGLPADAPEQRRRLALARWIASAENPLTARVMVNRIWQHYFGQGIVSTPSDFGHNGVPPTHPELVDWLAAEFIQHGWSVKWLQRQILRSATFAQSSEPRIEALKIDASDRYLWRFPLQRLEAEPIRDCILQAAGTLDLTMGGPGFLLFENVRSARIERYLPLDELKPEHFRRMVYMARVRKERDRVFSVFDCPDGSQSMPVRGQSTTPLQAFNLLNSKFVLQQAQAFADRLRQEAGNDVDMQIGRAFQRLYLRQPASEERARARELIDTFGLESFCRALFNTNEFLFIR